MRIALIKSSSMGDVIHALPVASDLVAAHPGIEIDWLVEEAFADLPALHPAVSQVVPVAVRRWRRTPLAGPVRAVVAALRARLRERHYDLALDLQGLLKSAWLAWLTGAPVQGFDRASVREPLACLLYRERFRVPHALHAIERLRQLAGLAMGHAVQGLPVFNLRPVGEPPLWGPTGPYAVFLHATSRTAKQWPAAHWPVLARALLDQGLSVVLPWGGAPECEQARAIAQSIAGQRLLRDLSGRSPDQTRATEPCVLIAPRMRLAECAALIAPARAVVGVDTGLTHLAAALSAPTVALFAATPAWRFGPYWSPRAVSLGSDGQWPQPEAVLQALAGLPA